MRALPRDRAAAGVLGLAGLTALVAAACRAALTWDGSYYLFATLDRQAPFVAHGRVLVGAVLWPVVWLSRLTGDVDVLAAVFSLLYALVPVVALTGAWVLARPRPDLFAWAVLAICLGTLPGQLFWVSEAVIAVQLGWPVLVWAATGAPRRGLPVAAAFAVATLLAHPFAAPMLGLAAGLVVLDLLRGRGSGTGRRIAVVVVLLAVGAGRLLLVAQTGYEESSATLEVVVRHFREGVLGLPLVALVAGWSAGALLLLVRRGRARDLAAGVLAAVAAGALLVWAADPGRWWLGLSFRTWAFFTTMPFALLLAVGAWRRDPRAVPAAGAPAPASVSPVVAVVPAVVWAVVLGIQAVLFAGTLARLDAEVAAAGPCVEEGGLEAVRRTALDHWGRRAAALLVQGRAPRTLVVREEECATIAGRAELRIAPFEARDRAADGWFTLPGPGAAAATPGPAAATPAPALPAASWGAPTPTCRRGPTHERVLPGHRTHGPGLQVAAPSGAAAGASAGPGDTMATAVRARPSQA